MTLVSMLPVIWLTVILAAIFCEALTEKLVAVWCAPAAASAFICGLFGIPPRIQLLVFVSACGSMIAVSRLVCSFIKRSDKHNNTDTDIE